MKLAICCLVLSLAAGAGLGALPQDPPASPKPGPQHALLHRHVGTWDAVVIGVDPTGVEQRGKATMTTEKHTDFHTLDAFRGEVMGLPFLGHGVNSYCPMRKKFISSWTDSMSPSPLLLIGSYDEAKKELTMTGEAFGASGKLEPCRTVTAWRDDDHFAWELHGRGADGKEVRLLRIEYTRRK